MNSDYKQGKAVPAKTQRTPWLIATVAGVLLAVVSLCADFVGTYMQLPFEPYDSWIWGTFWTSLGVTVVSAIAAMREPTEEDDFEISTAGSSTLTARSAPRTVMVGGSRRGDPAAPSQPVDSSKGKQTSAHARATSPARRGKAPVQPDSFVGRESALNELKQRLGVGKSPRPSGVVQVLTSAHGWMGVGRASVAAALANDKDVAKAFPDGVMWASLGESPSVIAELAQWGRARHADDVTLMQDVERASGRLAGLMRDKRALLIVDDARDVKDVEPFRVGGSGCAMLVTTPQDDVAQAVVEDPKDVYELDLPSEDEALKLLAKLLPGAASKHRQDSLKLIQQLDGLPLAIQLAGRLLTAKPGKGPIVGDLVEEIRKGTAALTIRAVAGRTDIATDTTPAVAVLLEKCVQDLEPHIRERFEALGAFAPRPASFDADALCAVWLIENSKSTVDTLVARGLLECVDGNERYRIHPVLKRLAAHLGDHEEAYQRHSSHYGMVAAMAEFVYKQSEKEAVAGMELFDCEWANVVAGQRWAAANWETDDEAASLCMAYALRSPEIMLLRLPLRKQVEWLEVALKAARQSEDRHSEGTALSRLGNAYYSLGEYALATQMHEQALEISRKSGSRASEGQDLGNLGAAYFSQGEYHRAIEYHERALAMAKLTGDREAEEQALGGLGSAYFSLDDYDSAIEYYEKRLSVARAVRDRRAEGNTLSGLGIAYDSKGDHARAIEYHQQSRAIAGETGYRQGEATALYNWSLALNKPGDRHKAVALAQEALLIYEQVESPYAEKVRKMLAEWAEEDKNKIFLD